MSDEEKNAEAESVKSTESVSKADRSRVIASTVLGILWVTMPPLFGFWILAEIGAIGDWLRSLGGPMLSVGGVDAPLYGLLVYAGMFMVASGIGILPTYAQAILGGWIFGAWLGTPFALLGFTGGAIIGWVLCRLISKDAVEHWMDRKPKWSAVRHAFVDDGFWRTLGIVTLIRLPPNSPFSLTNLAMSAGGVRAAPYILGTIIGMAPRTAIACAFAAAAAADGSKDIQGFLKDKTAIFIVGIVCLIIVFSILAKVANKALAKVLPETPLN